ncbi:MAG: flagellar biosynthetic protein FliR [Massilia sp.]
MLAAFFISVRLAALLLLTPALSPSQVPPSVRVLLVLGLSANLALGFAFSQSDMPTVMPTDQAGIAMAVLTEAALGAVMALSVQLAFGAFSLAAALLDLQIGFGMAAVFDPVTRRQLPIVTTAMNLVAAMVFLLVNGHHALLRGVAFSLEHFPPGHPWAVEPVYGVLMKKVASLFGLGFSLAAPVACCLLFVEFTLGVISRNLPQMNIFVVGIPAKIVAGMIALAVWYGGAGVFMARIYQSIYSGWDEMFGVAKLRSNDGW